MSGIRRRRGPRGYAYNELIFRSAIARQGGPIRLSLSSIDRNSTREGVLRAATLRGWRVICLGAHWLLFDNRLPVTSIFAVPKP